MSWKLQPGFRRRAFVFTIVVLAAGLAIFLSLSHLAQDLWLALGILVVSLVGFHIIALTSYDCAWSWRFVDYPWVLTTFMTILVALTNIYETSRAAPLMTALAERKAAYENLLYSLKSVITNDCHPKPSRAGMWTVSPEPYKGACDRMEHFLPQIEDAAIKEATLPGLNSHPGWGQDIEIHDTSPVGSWAGLDEEARRLTKNDRDTQSVLERVAKLPRSPIASWAQSSALKFWYFALAFFLGLRLSKITADVLAARPPRLPSASNSKDDDKRTSREVNGPTAPRPDGSCRKDQRMIRRKLVRLLLGASFVMAIVVGAVVLVRLGPGAQTSWALIASVLAVVTACLSALSSQRLMEVAEDEREPILVLSLDIASRYQLVQLRLKNVGRSSAYDIAIKWNRPLTTVDGGIAAFADTGVSPEVVALTPDESVSTLLGVAHRFDELHKNEEFSGEIRYRTATGVRHATRFRVSTHNLSRRLKYDEETLKTHYELQHIPEALGSIRDKLAEIHAALERLSPVDAIQPTDEM
jgi:hypothetical protein